MIHKFQKLQKTLLFFSLLVWMTTPATASDLDCNIAMSKCELKTRSAKIKTPCDAAIRCEALALCNLQYCVCRQAGSGHLGGVGGEVDPAAKYTAQIMCGQTHGRVGKCQSEADKCIAYMKNQYNESHGNQGNKPPKPSNPKPPKPNTQDNCNPNFDPANIKGENDRPCIR